VTKPEKKDNFVKSISPGNAWSLLVRTGLFSMRIQTMRKNGASIYNKPAADSAWGKRVALYNAVLD
jgi:hypothetical protein